MGIDKDRHEREKMMVEMNERWVRMETGEGKEIGIEIVIELE
jgi:hypothetical protein